jgi:hypothetical protein
VRLFGASTTYWSGAEVIDPPNCRLKNYLKEKSFKPDDRIFLICYEAARAIVRKAGNATGVKLRLHDLRRHAATHVSRSGVPVETVSKVIPRHRNLVL